MPHAQTAQYAISVKYSAGHDGPVWNAATNDSPKQNTLGHTNHASCVCCMKYCSGNSVMRLSRIDQNPRGSSHRTAGFHPSKWLYRTNTLPRRRTPRLHPATTAIHHASPITAAATRPPLGWSS